MIHSHSTVETLYAAQPRGWPPALDSILRTRKRSAAAEEGGMLCMDAGWCRGLLSPLRMWCIEVRRRANATVNPTVRCNARLQCDVRGKTSGSTIMAGCCWFAAVLLQPVRTMSTAGCDCFAQCVSSTHYTDTGALTSRYGRAAYSLAFPYILQVGMSIHPYVTCMGNMHVLGNTNLLKLLAFPGLFVRRFATTLARPHREPMLP